MQGYGQFCPVAQAAEVIAERWTPLVIRELLSGSHRFNDIQRGVPLMSPALLTKRLKNLELCDIIERRSLAGGGHEYHLTQAGEELRPWVELMGVWGQRWVRRPVTPEEADPALLMWDMRRRASTSSDCPTSASWSASICGVHQRASVPGGWSLTDPSRTCALLIPASAWPLRCAPTR
jgi:DNA-binding HxlR family transcriptional regulator